jgi:crossover junction endodeoxyribonuclease RuvC
MQLKNQMIKCGIDYSMTSPGIAIVDGDSVKMFGLSSKKKELGVHQISENITLVIEQYPSDYTNNIERFKLLSKWITSKIPSDIKEINLEGYSMGSRAGQVFTIAENTTILKLNLLANGITINIIAPTSLKKFATGKGNANKHLMMTTFCSKFEITNPNLSSFNDCVDAYFLSRYNCDFYEIIKTI